MLKHILGTVPAIKILDFFLDNDGTDYITDEIQKYAEVRPVDMKDVFPRFIECGIIIETRKIRGASLYKLDHDNLVTQALITFYSALSNLWVCEGANKFECADDECAHVGDQSRDDLCSEQKKL